MAREHFEHGIFKETKSGERVYSTYLDSGERVVAAPDDRSVPFVPAEQPGESKKGSGKKSK